MSHRANADALADRVHIAQPYGATGQTVFIYRSCRLRFSRALVGRRASGAAVMGGGSGMRLAERSGCEAIRPAAARVQYSSSANAATSVADPQGLTPSLEAMP
jgi:hypothetical protein